jgi:DNA-binding PadR family transcriptional regulator
MEERKLIDSAWGMTQNGRRARYYRLTSAGRVRLRAEAEALVDHVTALAAVLTAKTLEP